MSFGREGIGVQGNEGVFGALLLETVVESDEARQVFGVGDECRPHCFISSDTSFTEQLGSCMLAFPRLGDSRCFNHFCKRLC